MPGGLTGGLQPPPPIDNRTSLLPLQPSSNQEQCVSQHRTPEQTATSEVCFLYAPSSAPPEVTPIDATKSAQSPLTTLVNRPARG